MDSSEGRRSKKDVPGPKSSFPLCKTEPRKGGEVEVAEVGKSICVQRLGGESSTFLKDLQTRYRD